MANSSVIVAAQSVWDTPATTGWREIEVSSDGHKTRAKPMDYKGIRSATGAKTARNWRQVIEGGDGTIEVPGFSNGLGILLAPFFDTAVSALHSGGTLAHDQTFTWGPEGPPANKNITTVVRREQRTAGTLDDYKYPGGRGVQLDVTQDVDANLLFKLVYDYRKPIRANLSSPSITQVEADLIYNWADATIELDGSAACVDSFNLSLPTGIDVGDKCIKQGDNRHTPMRKGTPEPTGTLKWKYDDPGYYDAFISGEPMPLTATWVGPVAIESSTYPSLTISLGAIRFTGEDPEISVDEATMQNLPFEILDNEEDPVVQFVFVTSDAAL